MNTNTTRTTQHIVLTAIVALGLGTVAAAAQAGEAAPTRVVHYANLDLGTPAGVKALQARIQYAAEEVCGGRFTRELQAAIAARACMNRAAAEAEHAMNDARLARVNNGHTV